MNKRLFTQKMQELKYTPDSLAAKCHVTPEYMKKFVLRGLVPSKAVRAHLAETLKCSISELYPDEDYESAHNP